MGGEFAATSTIAVNSTLAFLREVVRQTMELLGYVEHFLVDYCRTLIQNPAYDRYLRLGLGKSFLGARGTVAA